MTDKQAQTHRNHSRRVACSLIRSLVLGCGVLSSIGCGELVTHVMVVAPNRGDPVEEHRTGNALLRCMGIDREMRITVGPSDTSLRLWLIEPHDEEKLLEGAPRGTLILLHGYRGSSMWIRGMGKEFAEEGYRVVLVDLRGHGKSSGEYITFGVRESRDVVAVIDHLLGQGLITGRVGVWGISMGGATAIQAAALDSRIDTVVAVAPFTSLRDVAPGVLRKALPVYAWLIGESKIGQWVERAGLRAGFDPADTNVLEAIGRVEAPVLILHGEWDWIVPPEQGRTIHAAAKNATFTKLKWTGHLGAHFSPTVERESVEWFDRYLQ